MKVAFVIFFGVSKIFVKIGKWFNDLEVLAHFCCEYTKKKHLKTLKTLYRASLIRNKKQF